VKKIKSSIFFIFISTVLLIAYFYVNLNSQKSRLTPIVINNKTVFAEIADTEAKREKGLSFHKPLSDNEGMLFIFPTTGHYGFWMKDMLFDLDFIWINNNKIVEITQVVSHNKQEVIYQPKEPVDQVLEVNAGYTKRYVLKISDTVTIKR
jgi:uncharacterized membrane protein (UPF0127 family)